MQIAYVTPKEEPQINDWDNDAIYFVARQLDADHWQVVCTDGKIVIAKALVHGKDEVEKKLSEQFRIATAPKPTGGTGRLNEDELVDVLSRPPKTEKEN